MQIQRLQNLYLLIALILQVVSLFIPWWKTPQAAIFPYSDPILLIICCLAAAMALIGIFLFKNLRRQKLVAALCALFGLFAVTYGFALSFMDTDDSVRMALGACPMALGAIMAVMARNRVIHDEKLLRSADRLR